MLVKGDPENPPPLFEKEGGRIVLDGNKYWTMVQDWAEKNDVESNDNIEKMVLEAQRLAMKLPVSRTVVDEKKARAAGACLPAPMAKRYPSAEPQVGDTFVLNIVSFFFLYSSRYFTNTLAE